MENNNQIERQLKTGLRRNNLSFYLDSTSYDNDVYILMDDVNASKVYCIVYQNRRKDGTSLWSAYRKHDYDNYQEMKSVSKKRKAKKFIEDAEIANGLLGPVLDVLLATMVETNVKNKLNQVVMGCITARQFRG